MKPGRKIKILHITPHLGGGVGRVLLNYLLKVKDDSIGIHEVVTLEYANENAIEVTRKAGISLTDRMWENTDDLLNRIKQADIVLIHWWNHPLLYDFMVRNEFPSSRVIMWSHTSGFNAPYVFNEKIINYPELFVFTTPISFETDEIKNLSEDRIKTLRVVWSTGGVDHVKNVEAKEHSGFNVGYIGTVDYCKMHPDFLDICARINVPGIKFIVCGGSKEKEIHNEAEMLGLNSKVRFTGLVSDITPYLSEFDVFGYPLAPYHYGTCDQALAESMAAGIVPVVIANRMEKSMVKDGITGIVTENENEYITAIEELSVNKELKNRLSNNAKEYAIKTFSLDSIKQEWEKVFEEALTFSKSSKKWNINKEVSELSPMDIFLESLGEHGNDFYNYCNSKNENEKMLYKNKIKELAKSALWQTETKGTVHHYYSFFKNDSCLSEISKLMKAAAFTGDKIDD